MDRDCNQCVYSTREGGCRKFKCEGTKTVEDIRAEVINEMKDKLQLSAIYTKTENGWSGMTVDTIQIEEISNELKEQK